MINVFSDYAGSARGSWYDLSGVLYMDLDGSRHWDTLRRLVRERFLPDGRRMSFKALGDRQRQKALVPFLQAADRIEGLCLVVAVRKSLGHLCIKPEWTTDLLEKLQLRKRWRHPECERLMRTAHLVALLIGGLAVARQAVYWISDEDDMLANHSISTDLQKLVSRFSSLYARVPLGELGLGTTAIGECDRMEEDNVAITDLAAGAISEVLTSLAAAAGGHIPPRVAVPFKEALSPKTDLVYSWFCQHSGPLRKVCIVFERLPTDQLAVFRLNCFDDRSS